MSPICYIADQTLYVLKENKIVTIPCEAIEQFKKNLNDIKQRKQWKSSGTGAQFMGVHDLSDDIDFSNVYPTGAIQIDENKIIYTARLQEGSSICIKNLNNLQEVEGLILRKSDCIIHDMDYDSFNRRLILSVSHAMEYEQHLCILALDRNHVQYMTEGECLDAHPCFNLLNLNEIFYDSCGISYTYGIDLGPREIFKLDLTTGHLETVVSDPKYDFLKPKTDQFGNLYFIRRPYARSQVSHPFTSLKDVIQAPFKIIRAIIGWLDFFTQRYSGESLKTSSGVNPVKMKQKTEEELFVEGNLIKAQQTLEHNQRAGEKYPGVIPSSWELMKLTPSGEMMILKKGVMSFLIQEERIVYSNGKYLIALNQHADEVILKEEKLVAKIS